MIRPTRQALAALWLQLHPGVVAACIFFPIFMILLGIWKIPAGPAHHMVGRVESIGFRVGKAGVYPTAYVGLPDRYVMVILPQVHTCRAGGLIRIVRQHYLWGPSFLPEVIPCG